MCGCGPKPHLKAIPGIILSKGINTHKQRLQQLRFRFAFALSFVAAVKRTHAPALRVLYATAAVPVTRIRRVSRELRAVKAQINICAAKAKANTLFRAVCTQLNPFIDKPIAH